MDMMVHVYNQWMPWDQVILLNARLTPHVKWPITQPMFNVKMLVQNALRMEQLDVLIWLLAQLTHWLVASRITLVLLEPLGLLLLQVFVLLILSQMHAEMKIVQI